MRTCLFCNIRLTRANRSKEHVIPRWIVAQLDYRGGESRGATLTKPGELCFPHPRFEARDIRKQSSESLVLGGVCTGCNCGWMSKLEVEVRPILEAFWANHLPTVLSSKQCRTLARWTYKTACAVSYASNYKKMIPQPQIRQFYADGRLPENATVDIAFCAANGLHWVIGGNKKVVVLSANAQEILKKAYVITLQFEQLLLRLTWTPDKRVTAIEFADSMCRIFPLQQPAAYLVFNRVFKDRWQFHFSATMLAEDGVYKGNCLGVLPSTPPPFAELIEELNRDRHDSR
jgi:hypothetical protein